jgi:Rrf2 family protein
MINSPTKGGATTLMFFSRTATYAIRAMAHIAQENQEKPMLVRQIAEAVEAPPNFLSKIVNRLVHEGLLDSARGRSGGVTLARPAGGITLAEVVSPFMRIDEQAECIFSPKICDKGCGLHNRWNPILEDARRFLRDTTIDQAL